jgi:hypothetical protein
MTANPRTATSQGDSRWVHAETKTPHAGAAGRMEAAGSGLQITKRARVAGLLFLTGLAAVLGYQYVDHALSDLISSIAFFFVALSLYPMFKGGRPEARVAGDPPRTSDLEQPLVPR